MVDVTQSGIGPLIFLNGFLTNEDIGSVIKEIAIINIEEKPANGIYLFFNNVECEIDQSLAAIDAIQASKIPVIAINCGICETDPFFIFICCSKRYAMANSLFCVGEIVDVIAKYKKRSGVNSMFYEDRRRERILQLFKRNSSVNDYCCNLLLSEMAEMSSEDGFRLGFVDEILGSFEEVLCFENCRKTI